MVALPSSLNTYFNLCTLSEKTLDNIKQCYNENKDLSDSCLIQLHSVYGEIAEKALVLLEESSFVCFTTENQKLKLYQMTGSSGTNYILYPNINFCECSAFKYQVCRNEPLYLTCKHRLAIQLAEITGKFKEETLSYTNFVNTILLCEIPDQ